MNSIIRDLIALQQILDRRDHTSPGPGAQAAELEKKIPQPLLAHFSRQLACHRRGVAFVRNGVCSACHIRVSLGTGADLDQEDDVLLCESCGCYLAPPPAEEQTVEKPLLATTPPPRRGRRRKLTVAAV